MKYLPIHVFVRGSVGRRLRHCVLFDRDRARDLRTLWLRVLLCVSSVTCALPSQAQTSHSKPVDWRDGLKLIDTSSPADIMAARSILEQAGKKERLPAAAQCTLALCHLRQEEPGEALKALAEHASAYTAAEQETTRGLALRINLVAALMLEDASAAELAFKDLVRLVVAEKADQLDLRLAAHSIGSTVAMLEIDLAKSPIPAKALAIGSERMLVSKVRGVEAAYRAAYGEDSERAGALMQSFELIADKGLDFVTADNAVRQATLKSRVLELDEQKKFTSEIIRNTQDQIDQNTLDQRKLAKEISALSAKERQPTPGHPGPKAPPPPPPPRRSTINVEEYEIRTDYEYFNDQNGQQIRRPVTRQVRRPQYEIDRERDAVYSGFLRDYEHQMADYRQYDTTYKAGLASWSEADRRRRQELSDKKAEAEARRAELIADSQEFKEEKKDSARQLKGKRTAQQQEEFELQIQSEALAAFQSGKTYTAFRPPHFSTILWSQEKVLLQRYAN